MMRLLDVFAGIGGFSEGFRAHGAVTVGAVEVDAAARRTFTANHPGVPIWNDVRTVDTEELPDCDIVTGGFPCQAFSRNGRWFNKNGKTLGNDDRANLFLSLARIIGAKRPKYFLLENVKGLLSMKNADGTLAFDVIYAAFQELGYRVKWRVLSPHLFGLPQQRERIFFVGFREDLAAQADRFRWPAPFDPECWTPMIWDILSSDEDHSRHAAEVVWATRIIRDSPKREDARGHAHAPGSSRLEAMRVIYALNIAGGRVPTALTGRVSPVAVLYGDTPSGGPRQQDKVYSPWGLCPTLTTLELVVPMIDLNPWRRLSPRECARLQGFPDTFVLPEADGDAYHQLGNAVCVKVVQEIGRCIKETES